MTSVVDIDNLDKSGSPLNPDSAGETTLDDVDVTIESDGAGWCVVVGVASQSVLVDVFKVGDIAALSDSQGTHMSHAPTPAKPAVVSEGMVTCTQSELGCVLVRHDVTVGLGGTCSVTSTAMLVAASAYAVRAVRLFWTRTRSRMTKIVTAMPTSSPPITPPTMVPALVLDLELLFQFPFPFPFPFPLPFPAFPAFPAFPLTAPWEMVRLATLRKRRGLERKYLDGSLKLNLREGEVREHATKCGAG